jgi:hypothetical protein
MFLKFQLQEKLPLIYKIPESKLYLKIIVKLNFIYTHFSTEYINLIQNGFESPKFTLKVFEGAPTPVSAPANVNFLWQPTDPRDQNLWQNVEFVKLENFNNIISIF